MSEMYFLYAYGNAAKRNAVIEILMQQGESIYSHPITNTHDYDGSENALYYIDVETYNIEKCTASSETGQLLLDTGDLIEAPPLNLPTTWNEYLEIVGENPSQINMMFESMSSTMASFPAKNYSSAYIAFIKLIYIRDYYRNGWLPDLESPEPMFVIIYNNNVLCTATTAQNFNNPLSFQSTELRDIFANAFSDLLEQAAVCLGWNDDE